MSDRIGAVWKKRIAGRVIGRRFAIQFALAPAGYWTQQCLRQDGVTFLAHNVVQLAVYAGYGGLSELRPLLGPVSITVATEKATGEP